MALLTISANPQPTQDTQINRYQAGEAITAGYAVYQDSADDGKIKHAQSDGTEAESQVIGIAMNPASDDGWVDVAESGSIVTGGTMTVGELYTLSETPGRVQDAPSHDAGMYPVPVFAAVTAAIAKLMIGYGSAKHA